VGYKVFKIHCAWKSMHKYLYIYTCVVLLGIIRGVLDVRYNMFVGYKVFVIKIGWEETSLFTINA